MNFLQLILFLIFAASAYIAGIGLLRYLEINDDLSRNKWIETGEALLLGGMLSVGVLLILSIAGLYRNPFLWGAVALNYLFLLNPDVRRRSAVSMAQWLKLNFSELILCLLLIVFFIRNSYFLIDVDSHHVYLYAQKLWLHHGSSLFADRALDMQIFVPHFDAVPYSLGLSLFAPETYFCQLINAFWRAIVIMLVYGYASHRLSGFLGLAASMMVLFNDHFFASGANEWVLINGAVIAFLFAVTYNLWESHAHNNSGRLVLCFIFLTQLIANKYQMAYITVFYLAFMLLLTNRPFDQIKGILKNKKWLWGILASIFIASLWFIKNWIATGWPLFPVLAGKFNILGWTPEMHHAFMNVFRGVSPNEFFKYMNYLFVWPGVHAAKIVTMAISLLPIIILTASLRNALDRKKLLELCFWLGISIAILLGICLASHQDPRYYRYPLGISAFAAVYAIHFILSYCIGIKKGAIVAIIALVLAMPGYKVMIHDGARTALRPGWRDNFGVLANKLHINDVINKHYPLNIIAEKKIAENPEKFKEGAWMFGKWSSPFLLPIKPQLGVWTTTVIRWGSYNHREDVIKDLSDYGIEWVMEFKKGDMSFKSAPEFAKDMVAFNRHPKKISFPYSMPDELTRTKFND